jgi:hypothetical protein
MSRLTIEIRRHTYTRHATLGDLYLNGKRFCHVLEDAVRGEGIKVKAHTAIPEGTYPVAVTYSPRFDRMMPLVMNVPNFEGIRIHGGNTHENTEGCPLVAWEKVNDFTIQGTAESALTDKIEEYDTVFLVVKNTNLLTEKNGTSQLN